jgi:hypothetical protein
VSEDVRVTESDLPENTPPRPAEDITELIVEDHHRLRLMFLRLEDVRDDVDALSRRWHRLSTLLELHASAEEETFYPRLLKVGADDAADETDDAIGDHNDIRDAIARAAERAVGSKDWWEAVYEARSENSKHLHEEETEALPDFRANTSADVRAERAQAWREYRAKHPEAEGLSGEDKDPEEYIAANR